MKRSINEALRARGVPSLRLGFSRNCYKLIIVKIKKESLIVIFYILYFSWLFTIVFMSPNTFFLNYFTMAIVLFYLILLRESGDVFWFIATSGIIAFGSIVQFSSWRLDFDLENLYFTPLWLPLAWGTTILALRKLYYIVVK